VIVLFIGISGQLTLVNFAGFAARETEWDEWAEWQINSLGATRKRMSGYQIAALFCRFMWKTLEILQNACYL
jgi:hypothetical protein